jgi:hypothetical protein
LDKRLTLKPAKWYGWQMLPGYAESYEPYFSPILVEKVTPEKSGKGWLRLAFYNAFYAEGVQGFNKQLKVLDRTDQYLIARLDDPEPMERHAIVSRISFEWIEARFPDWYREAPKESMPLFASSEIDYYLNQRFFGTLRPIGPVPS